MKSKNVMEEPPFLKGQGKRYVHEHLGQQVALRPRGHFSRLSYATMEAVASLGDPPPFEPLKEFFEYLETEYGGIRRDRMRHIQDFQREKGDTPRIMYAR